jgi:hypothetical protein
MADSKEILPLDARLLSDSIIELNISRRNVAIYPEDHPSVQRSLDRAFDLLQKLFDIRPEITLGIAKDTLVIDNHYLDKKNPVYQEFATYLSGLGIASVTFLNGLSKDDIYAFHRFLSETSSQTSVEEIKGTLKSYNLKNIALDFVDYDSFVLEEGKTESGGEKKNLWELYLFGFLEGTLQKNEGLEVIRKIPPEMLASLLNEKGVSYLKEESYDRVITTYIRSSSERFFSDTELKKLLDFIHSLRPELKKQFLSSTMKNISSDMVPIEKALGEVSVDRVIELLSVVNEHKIMVPEALKNLIDKFSKIDGRDDPLDLFIEDSPILDDILLSPDIINLLSKGDFEAFVTEKYNREIQELLEFEPGKLAHEEMKELKEACEFEALERAFSRFLLELINTNMVSHEDMEKQIPILLEQCQHYVETGQYFEALNIIKGIEKSEAKKIFPDLFATIIEQFHSEEFISSFVESLRIMGRLNRDETTVLCNYYGEKILPYLFDVLFDEESKATRRFIITLITGFGKRSVSETIKRLDDDRWFVKRNMIFILTECGDKEVIPHVKPYCQNENIQVSTEAIKCLLQKGERDGIAMVMKNIRSDSKKLVNQAITLSGTFKIKEAVPEILRMVEKKGVTGADYLDKIPLVAVLGKIGDPSAIGALKNLMFSKSILFKSAIERLREEVFKTLKHYPLNDVRGLAEAGAKSKNDVIREESLKLLKSGKKIEATSRGNSHGTP